MITGKCDTCNKDDGEIGVASLPFAPMSVAFCRDCLKQGAYPLWALHIGIEMCGGSDEVADWFKLMNSFHNGKYISGKEVMALYAQVTSDRASDNSTD